MQEMTFNLPTAIIFALCIGLFILALIAAVRSWTGKGGCHGGGECPSRQQRHD